jgi:Tfp pilus assembly protein PilN
VNTPNQLSFLPDDYLQQKAQRRAVVICAALLVCVMGGLVWAFAQSESATRRVEDRAAAVDEQYIREAERIARVAEMREKQKRMAHQAEMTAALLERVPRSLLLAELTNLLPAGVFLLEVTLDSKVAAPPPPPPGTALEARKARGGAAEPPAPRKYDVTLKVSGVALNDGQVAQYLKKLAESALLRDVNLLVTEEYTLDKQPMRRFQMEMLVNADVDLPQAAPRTTARLDATGGDQ